MSVEVVIKPAYGVYGRSDVRFSWRLRRGRKNTGQHIKSRPFPRVAYNLYVGLYTIDLLISIVQNNILPFLFDRTETQWRHWLL